MHSNPFDPKHFDPARASEALRGVVDYVEKNLLMKTS